MLQAYPPAPSFPRRDRVCSVCGYIGEPRHCGCHGQVRLHLEAAEQCLYDGRNLAALGHVKAALRWAAAIAAEGRRREEAVPSEAAPRRRVFSVVDRAWGGR